MRTCRLRSRCARGCGRGGVPGRARAAGLLIPEDEKLPPLAMVNHKVDRRHRGPGGRHHRRADLPQPHRPRSSKRPTSSRCPRAPASTSSPCGSTARRPAASWSRPSKARKIYTDIVRRTQDPGLLEYMGNNLLRLRVFPVPPKGDQKVTISFTSVAPKDGERRRVRLPAQDRRQGDRARSKSSRSRSTHQVAARRSRTSTARRTPSPSTRKSDKRSDRSTSRRNQAHARQGLPALLRLGDKDVGLTAADAPADRGRGRLLHVADLAAGRSCRRRAGAARHGARARHLRQHADDQDGRRRRRRSSTASAQLKPDDRFASSTSPPPYNRSATSSWRRTRTTSTPRRSGSTT